MPRGRSVLYLSAANGITCFSQASNGLNLVAPGVAVTAGGRANYTGTSMAAPHVAGAVAVLAQASGSSSVTQAIADKEITALVNSGPWVSDSRSGSVLQRHRLDLPSALTAFRASLDSTAPAVTAPVTFSNQGSTIGSATPAGVQVNVTWLASDTSGISGYELWVSTNGGAFTKLGATTSPSMLVNTTAGNSYRFRVWAKDGAGNWGSCDGATFGVQHRQETHTSIGYTGTWTNATWSSASGGGLRMSSQANASAKVTFTGSSVSWISTRAANRGQAWVYVDGQYKETIDLSSSSTTGRSVVTTWYWPTSGAHSLQVVVVGTAGRPTVDVDSFIVLG